MRTFKKYASRGFHAYRMSFSQHPPERRAGTAPPPHRTRTLPMIRSNSQGVYRFRYTPTTSLRPM